MPLLRSTIAASTCAAFAALVLAAACADAQPGPSSPPPPAKAAPESPAPASGAPAGGSAAEACADAWLTAHKLNRFGDPPGTMYPGGTPLFNERTGKMSDRLAHLFPKLPDLRAACSSPDAH